MFRASDQHECQTPGRVTARRRRSVSFPATGLSAVLTSTMRRRHPATLPAPRLPRGSGIERRDDLFQQELDLRLDRASRIRALDQIEALVHRGVADCSIQQDDVVGVRLSP
jgi:hypothetical protein